MSAPKPKPQIVRDDRPAGPLVMRCCECGAEFEAQRPTGRYCRLHNTAAQKKLRQRNADGAKWGPTVLADRWRPPAEVQDLLDAQGIGVGGPTVAAWNADHSRFDWTTHDRDNDEDDGGQEWKIPAFKRGAPRKDDSVRQRPIPPQPVPPGYRVLPLDSLEGRGGQEPWRQSAESIAREDAELKRRERKRIAWLLERITPTDQS